jgi:RNA-binding protein YhbY
MSYNKINLEKSNGPNGVMITEKSLKDWLINEINRVATDKKLIKMGVGESSIDMFVEIGRAEAYNNLLKDLGEPYYCGKSDF